MAGHRMAVRKPRRQTGVARYIEDELAARQWSERRLACEADLPVSVVRALLRGSPLTSRETAALARACRVPVGYLESIELHARDEAIKKCWQPGFW
jgi:hypothetical protein